MTDDDAKAELFAHLEEINFLKSQLTVTLEDYTQAVNKLMDVGMRDTGQSGTCAEVLLGLHNGYCFHVNVTNLCGLDLDLFLAALIAIRGRVMLSKEPHTVIDNGEARFKQLWEDWPGLEIKTRYQANE